MYFTKILNAQILLSLRNYTNYEGCNYSMCFLSNQSTVFTYRHWSLSDSANTETIKNDRNQTCCKIRAVTYCSKTSKTNKAGDIGHTFLQLCRGVFFAGSGHTWQSRCRLDYCGIRFTHFTWKSTNLHVVLSDWSYRQVSSVHLLVGVMGNHLYWLCLCGVSGVLISTVVLLLSQKALFKFYTLFFAVLLGMAVALINYYATSHIDFYSAYYKAALGFRLLPRNGPTLWLGMAAVQLVFGVGYVFLLNLQSVFAALVVLDIMIPLWGLMIELPADVRHLVAVFSGLVLVLNTAVCLAMRIKWFYYSCRYVYLLIRHMYRIYGLQLLLEDTWKRIRFPDVLRVFWLTRVTAQAMILVYVVRAVRRESGDATDGSSDSQVRLELDILD